MPSKESKETDSDYFPREVEDLVAAINHNLQLKSRPCMAVCSSKQRRVTPYTVPVRRTLCRKTSGDKENNLVEHSMETCKYCRMKSPIMDSRTDNTNCENPYDMLQDLIREGSLIKEAVKRLQLGLNCTKPRKTNFYDLEEIDVRSPHL